MQQAILLPLDEKSTSPIPSLNRAPARSTAASLAVAPPAQAQQPKRESPNAPVNAPAVALLAQENVIRRDLGDVWGAVLALAG